MNLKIRVHCIVTVLLFFNYLLAGESFSIGSSNSKPTGKNYALIIGINKYESHKKKVVLKDDNLACNDIYYNLHNSVEAALEVKKVLRKYYHFEESNIRMLTDREGSHATTRNNILNTLTELKPQIQGTDSLLVFFSGHGCFENQLKIGYLVASDGLLISGAELRSIFNFRAKHVFVITDACYSGRIFPGAFKSHNYLIKNEKLKQSMHHWEERKSRQILAASKSEVWAGEKNSINPFCKALIDSLKSNYHKKIDAQSIINEVTERIKGLNEGRNHIKTPVGGSVPILEDEGGQFIFRRLYSEKEEEISQIYKRVSIDYSESNLDLEQGQKDLTHIINFPNTENPVIEYYRQKSEKLISTIKSIGKLKKKYADVMSNILRLSTVEQMTALDSVLSYIDDDKEITEIKGEHEADKIISKIEDDKEMLLTYMRLSNKSEYKEFIKEYKNLKSKFVKSKVHEVKENLEILKIRPWFLGLDLSSFSSNFDISFINNEQTFIGQFSIGHCIETAPFEIIPFIRIAQISNSVKQDNFAIYKESAFSARFRPFIIQSTGIEFHEKTILSGGTFFVTVSHTLHFLKPVLYSETSLGQLKFKKNNNTIGLGTFDLGIGLTFGPRNSFSFILSTTYSIPLKSRIEYQIELAENHWLTIPYSIKEPVLRTDISIRFWFGKKR